MTIHVKQYIKYHQKILNIQNRQLKNRIYENDENHVGLLIQHQHGLFCSYILISNDIDLYIKKNVRQEVKIRDLLQECLNNDEFNTKLKQSCFCDKYEIPISEINVNLGENTVKKYSDYLYKSQFQHKFGIIYCDQLSNDEEIIMSCKEETEKFQNFLEQLGTVVQMDQHKGYSGETTKSPDIKCIYNQYDNHEILFHVITKIKFKENDKIQIERKRHIGNDNVIIIYSKQEPTEIQLKPLIMSQQIQIYVFVYEKDDKLKVKVYSKESSDIFDTYNTTLVLSDLNSVTDFLNLLINCSYICKSFGQLSQKNMRMRETLINQGLQYN